MRLGESWQASDHRRIKLSKKGGGKANELIREVSFWREGVVKKSGL